MAKHPTELFAKLPAFLNVGRRLHRRLIFPLLALLTAVLCLTGLPVLAKAHSSNSINTYAQVDGGEDIAGNLLKLAQDQEASGLYRRACGTLLQALELSNLDCKTLTRDEMDEKQLVGILQELPATPLRAAGLTSLGNVLRMLGAVKTSEVVLNRSLDLGMRAGADISAAYLGLGNTKRALGKRAEYLKDENGQQRYREALDDYEKAIATSVSDASTVRAKLNKLSLLVEMGYSEDIADLWRDVKGQVEKLPVAPESVYARIDLAQSLACLKVREMGEEERKQVPSPEPPIFRICTPNEKVETRKFASLQAVPEWKDAGQLLAVAAQQAEKLKEVRSQSYALGTLGELYELTQQGSDAAKLTENALLLAQSIQGWDVAYKWQWQLGRLSLKTQKNRSEALMAYTAAFNNLQSLRKDLGALNSDMQFNFRDEVEPVYRELVDLLLQPEPGKTEPSQENLKQARNAIEGLQLAELDNFFRNACAVAQPKWIDEIVDKSDPKAAFIYAIILKNRLSVILKLPGQDLIYHETLKSQEDVENTLRALRTYLSESSSKTPDVREESKKVYKWLIEPFEKDLEKETNKNIETLVFVLDRPLQNIPIAVLCDEKSDKYLLENKYALALAPGLQLINPKTLQQLQSRPIKLFIGGVGIENRIQISNQPAVPLPEIKKFREELVAISNIVPAKGALLDTEFTKSNLQQLLAAGNFSAVHIKTHGKFSSDPDQTYIAAYQSPIKSKDWENLVQSGSQEERNPIELLVLSACETAEGDDRAMLGLAGIAVRAGARTIVSTLWEAQDAPTTELMKRFYQELSKPGMTRAKALHLAQQEIFSAYTDPYNWATYVLVGNWL